MHTLQIGRQPAAATTRATNQRELRGGLSRLTWATKRPLHKMWHATTKVVGSGAQKPLHDLAISRCATAAAWSQIKPHQNQKHCVRLSQLAPASSSAAPPAPCLLHLAAVGPWQSHNNFSSAAAFYRKMWSTRLNWRCRRRNASVVTSHQAASTDAAGRAGVGGVWTALRFWHWLWTANTMVKTTPSEVSFRKSSSWQLILYKWKQFIKALHR